MFLTKCVKNNSAKIYYEKSNGVCNVVYFRLCIDLMHITPPFTAEGYDASHEVCRTLRSCEENTT